MAKLFKVLKEQTKNEIAGISLVALASLFFLSFFLVPLESSVDSSKVGAVGVFIVRVFAGVTGLGRFVLPVIVMFLGLSVIRNKSKNLLHQKMLGMFMLFLCILAFLHFTIEMGDFKSYLRSGLQGNGGGLVGALLSYLLIKGFGHVGSALLLTCFFLVSLVLVTETSLVGVLKAVCSKVGQGMKYLKDTIFDFIFEEEPADLFDKSKPKTRAKKNEPQDKEGPLIISHGFMVDHEESQHSELFPAQNLPQPLEIIPYKNPEKQEKDYIQERVNEPEGGRYQLPKTDILQAGMKIKSPRINKDITDRIKILEETLESFGVKVKVTQVSCGPAITRYEMQPCPGVKVSKIVNLADDIALNLAASGVRIEAPVPGKSVIGIEVPKKEISTVGFREVLESAQFIQSSSKLTVALGQDITGNSVIADLSAMPHLLIAGATGSGKSVCMNTIICSVLFKASPAEVKFLMIDPKMVELTNYNGLPHLVSPVITDPKKAAGALKWAVYEMEKRYNLFASTGVKDLHRYNELKRGTEEVLPQIVVLIDELADLMMVAPGDVEDSICRLAQMARAAGIHLVVATQRPSVDVITGLIKANIPSRIAFAVSSQTDSRTILDMAGAEKLLGRGDMLFNPVGASKPIRVQGVYLSEDEIGTVVSFCKAQEKPEFLDEIVKNEHQTNAKQEEMDDLYIDAAKLVVTTGQASISLLQRRFRIGYSRAARLIDTLENKGIVGGYEGSKPRTVLMTLDQFERIIQNK